MIALLILVIGLSVLPLIYFLAAVSSQQPKEFKIKLSDPSRKPSDYYVTIVLNCTFPEFPKEMQTLGVIRRNFSETEATELVQQLFNMALPLQLSRQDSWLSIRNDAQMAVLYHDGGLMYHDDLTYSMSDIDWSAKSGLPDSSECEKIATAFLETFLEKLADYGLVPGLAQIEFAGVSVAARRWDSETNTSRDTQMGVGYTLKYNGMPTAGFGGIEVLIGDQGKIEGLLVFWRNVELGRNVKVTISAEEALKNIGSCDQLAHGLSSPRIERLIINKVELAYYVGPPVEKQNELVPVYLFSALAIREDGVQVENLLWMPATST